MIELNLINEKSEIDTLKEDMQRLGCKNDVLKEDVRRLKRKIDYMRNDNFMLKREKEHFKLTAQIFKIAFFTSLALHVLYAVSAIL